MRKLFATALACALALAPAGQAEASITRVLSLGVDNWQVHDSANFWFNPALLKDVPDMVHLELGTQAAAGAALTAGTQWGGFHKAWGRNVFALYVRRPYGANDFSAIANPLLTPSLGGMVTGASVTGVAGLDTGGFGINGPFGTDNGAGASGSLGITGAPGTLTKDIADPVNFLDFLWAIPIGWLSLGLRFNYARNAPTELRRSRYSNIGNGGTEGTLLMERLTDEYNIHPGLSIKGERARFDLVGHVSLIDYDMEYREEVASSAFATAKIDEDDALGGGIDAQLTFKVMENASLAIHARAGDQNAAGTASFAVANGAGVLTTNQSAAFDDRRRFLGGDVSWNYAFERALLVASVGYQRSQTKQTWVFRDVLAPGGNQDDLAKVDNDVVPARIGMEITPWDRIALRAGIQKNWFAETDAVGSDRDGGAAGTVTNTSTALAEAAGTANGVGLSFGMGFKLMDNLTVDTVVRQTFFFDGPNALGGQTPGVFAQGTLVYRFGLSRSTDDTLKPLLHYDEVQLY